MGEPEELKDCRGTFARQQTAVAPPGVWRQRKAGGECVSQEEPITAVLLEPFDSLCWWQMHPWSITPLRWVLKYTLNWLGSIQTESGFFSAPFYNHILCHTHCGLLIILFWFQEQRWFVSGAWWCNCLKFVFQASFEQQIHSDSLKLAAALTIRHRAFMDRAFNLGKRAGLCLSHTFYGAL